MISHVKLLLVLIKLGIFVSLWLTALCVLVLGCINSCTFHLFKALGISSAYEVSLHVVDTPLGIHQILLILPFNLNHSHHNTVNHIDRLTFFFFLWSLLLSRCHIVGQFILIFLLIYNFHGH